jgi:hypothetical protein
MLLGPGEALVVTLEAQSLVARQHFLGGGPALVHCPVAAPGTGVEQRWHRPGTPFRGLDAFGGGESRAAFEEPTARHFGWNFREIEFTQ